MQKYPDADLSLDPSAWFKASTRSSAGGVIRVFVGGVELSGQTVRQIFGLSSANFTVRTGQDGITFTCIGYGHGVGMSQYGARALAESGYSGEEIVEYYYTGAEVALYPPYII